MNLSIITSFIFTAIRVATPLIYGALEGIALITALYIYNKPGDLSYRVAWIIPILFVPVVGLILYLL